MYIKQLFTCLCAFCLLIGCSTQEPPKDRQWEEITGRFLGEGQLRRPLYRILNSRTWQRVETAQELPLEDTTLPLCEYVVEDSSGKVVIAIHNFPSYVKEDRTPPMAQIARWKRQFDVLDTAKQEVRPQSFSGFHGFLYEGEGIGNGERIAVMAWALQIGSEHYSKLSQPGLDQEMRSDVTIKARGPAAAVYGQRQAIVDFARSFELIEEIPAE